MNIKNNLYLALLRIILLVIFLILPYNKFLYNLFYKNFIKLIINPKNFIIINKKILKKNEDKGFIVICNHLNYVDLFIVRSLINCKVIARNTILKIGDKKNFNTIWYEKGNNKSGLYVKKKILTAINNKEVVLIFPEGKFNSNIKNNLNNFKPGLFHLAYENKIPILMSTIYSNETFYAIGNPLKLLKEIFFFNYDSTIIYELIDFVYPKKFKNFKDYYNTIYKNMNKNVKKY